MAEKFVKGERVEVRGYPIVGSSSVAAGWNGVGVVKHTTPSGDHITVLFDSPRKMYGEKYTEGTFYHTFVYHIEEADAFPSITFEKGSYIR